MPSPCVKNVMVTLILSSKASVSNGCSIGADEVKTTRFGMTCPSITFLSIKSGLGCGCQKQILNRNLNVFLLNVILNSKFYCLWF